MQTAHTWVDDKNLNIEKTRRRSKNSSKREKNVLTKKKISYKISANETYRLCQIISKEQKSRILCCDCHHMRDWLARDCIMNKITSRYRHWLTKSQSLFFIGHEKWESLKILFPINFMVLKSSTECFHSSFESKNCLGLLILITTTKLQHQFSRDNFFFCKTTDKGP